MAMKKLTAAQKDKLARYAKYARQYYRRLKAEAIKAYGGRCACCGEKDYRFLTLDHVNGDGEKIRRTFTGSKQCYRMARDAGYPDTYQILCWNCNCGRALNNGVCPHKDQSFNLDRWLEADAPNKALTEEQYARQ